MLKFLFLDYLRVNEIREYNDICLFFLENNSLLMEM